MYDFGEIKPNSHKSKEPEKLPEKKVEKVIEGNVVSKKKSPAKKFLEMFIAEDFEHVKSYIFVDVVIPAIKNALLDALNNGSQMLLWGDTKPKGSGSKISYSSISSKLASSPLSGRNLSQSVSRYSGDSDIILETREEAETVLSHLIELVETYESASVADLYDLLGKTPQFTDNKYGWTNLSSATTQRVREGYLLKLPKASPL